MDMQLTEAQDQLIATAKRALANDCPLGLVRELETSELGYSRELWTKMAELGWLGLPYPETYRGFELGAVDLALLAKELGRALVPGPYVSTVVLAGGAITAAGNDRQKQALLPRIASGDTIVAFALQEASAYYDGRGVSTTATETPDGYALSGTKQFVEFANAADWLLVLARTSGSGNDGLSMFIVDAKAPGVTMSHLSTLARDKQYRVILDGVQVAKDDLVGPAGDAWGLLEPVVQRGIVAQCAYMVGASEHIHEMATEFAKQRVQFGRPIGSFQAIQHYLAQSITEIVGADTMTLYAAWALDQRRPSRAIVAKAKALAGDTFKQASAVGAQIYGGLGFNEDVDTTLFLRRGKQYQLAMGDSGYWEDIVAEELLDR
jgi:alkylation response protein AidB-like acyl-CoA dehydrogenase